MIPVIRPEDDDRIIRQFQSIQLIQHLSHLRIEVTDRGQVSVPNLTNRVVAERAPFRAKNLSAVMQCYRGHIFGRLWIRRKRDAIAFGRGPNNVSVH